MEHIIGISSGIIIVNIIFAFLLYIFLNKEK